MRKVLFSLLAIVTTSVFAASNSSGNTSEQNSETATTNNSNSNAAFQQFENEYNLGFGFSQGGLINGQQQTSSYNEQMFNLEVERLFNNGIWLDGNFNMVTQYSQEDLGPLNGGNGSGSAFGQNPFMYGFSLKAGYGFQLIQDTLQIIPYAMLGRNSNVATSTVNANGDQTIASDYFYTGGIGARLDYRINNTIMLYADQLYSYNWDNSGAIKDIQVPMYGKTYAATNYEFTSTLGAKFNVWQSLQLGVNGFWTNYQPQSNISGLMYTPDNIFGMMATIGLTY